MKKYRICAWVVCAVLIIVSVSCSFAAFGDDVTYSFDEERATLRIFGTGDMADYADSSSAPWYSHMLKIKYVIIEQGVTSVGNNAFSGARSLQEVTIAESVNRIGEFAFSSCPMLEELTLGKNISSIADASFAFDGINPKQNFAVNVLPGTYALYYAVTNSVDFHCPSVGCGKYEVSVYPAGMKAYFPYTAKVNGTFKFSASGPHDTVGVLCDSSLAQIKYNDDNGADVNFSITADLVKGNTYYICASILNSRLTGGFELSIEPVTYTVNGTVNAMLNPSGTASDIILTDAFMDGEKTDGAFSCTVSNGKTAVFSCGNARLEYTFSPDNGDNIKIPLMVCDVNNDGWVNVKDFAIMRKTASPYIEVYENFINFKS